MELFKILGKIIVDPTEAIKQLENASNSAQKAFSKIGSGALAVGKVVATGLAAGATALGGLTVKALSVAGELEQNMGGSEAVFKEYASSMQETAKNAFSNMGLSASDFLATANKMGSLFQGSGFDIATSAKMSSEAMQRAADVASIMGIDTASAMEAIAGAAKGNFTMLDNLGVAMNDTTLQAYALEKGINKSTSQMTNQEKIGLAMEMFMEKTAYAAGNYAKENETLAGSLGTAKAALSNFLSGAGSVEDVVSSFSNFGHVVAKNISSLFPALMTGVTELFNQLAPMIPPLLEQVLPGLIEGATSLVNGIVENLPQFIDIVTTSLLPQLVSGLGTVFGKLVSKLPEIASALVSGFVNIFKEAGTGFQILAIALGTITAAVVAHTVAQKLKAIAVAAGAAAEGSATVAMGIHTVATNIATVATTAFGAAMSFLTSPITLVILAIGALIAIVVLCVKNWDKIKEAGAKAWEGIKNAWNKAGEWFSNVKDKIADAFANIKEKLSAPFEKARDTIKGIADKIKGFFTGEISMPKIKMPHFAISPSGWSFGDLLKGSIPSLGIDWYAKAMDNPMVMTKPTIFGYNAETGNLKGGGEAGSEVVSGTTTLMNMIQGAVASENNTIVIYLQHLIEILATYFPQILEAAGHDIVTDDGTVIGYYAPKIDEALGKIKTRKERGR